MSAIYIKFYVAYEWYRVIKGVLNALYYWINIPLIMNPSLPSKYNIPNKLPLVI